MNLDKDTAERMRAGTKAVAEKLRQHREDERASSEKSINAEDGRMLKAAGRDPKQKQPFGTLKALREMPAAQLDRVQEIIVPERMTAAARVSCLPVALSGLSDEARQGLEGYHSLYWAAQPSQAMSYEPRVPSSSEGGGDEDNAAWDALTACDRAIGPKIKRLAVETVRAERHAFYSVHAAGMAEDIGMRLANYFAASGE